MNTEIDAVLALERRRDRMELSGQINEAVQEYGLIVAAVARDEITDREALAIGLALGALKTVVQGWGKP